MTIEELIEQLEEARESVGGDALVKVANQPSWPLREDITQLTYNRYGDGSYGDTGDKDDPKDEEILWIAIQQDSQSPYAPRWAWDGEPPEADEECCPDCGRTENQPWDGECETCEPAADIKARYRNAEPPNDDDDD